MEVEQIIEILEIQIKTLKEINNVEGIEHILNHVGRDTKCDDLPKSTLNILKKEIEKSKENEIQIAIDPESFIGKEILWQSRKLINLSHKLDEIGRLVNG